MTIEARITAFISGPKPSAIAVIGRWGQGKTYFWRRVAEANAPAAKSIRGNYAYVSLFGLNSLPDLRVELAQRIRRVDQMKEDTFAALLQERASSTSWLARLGRWIFRQGRSVAGAATGASVGLPHIGNLGPLYRAWAYSQVKNALICLDDLERRGSGLDLKDVLGLVSQLVTERGCSVAVIFNDGSFEPEDKKIWDDNREKVFLGEVVYSVTPEKCLGYIYQGAVGDMTEIDQAARRAILDLGITNIRIIERIKNACDQVAAALPNELLSETRNRIARCLALYVYTVVGQGDGAPPPYEGKKSGLRRAFDNMKRKPADPEPTVEQQRWTQLLSRYGYYFHGELDDALMDAVNQGYPDAGRLFKAASEQDMAERLQAMDEEYTQAWRLFHDSFEDNGAEVVRRMSDAFFRLHANITSTNADATIRLMRALGEDQLADRMLDQWISDRANAERWKELAKREVEKFNPIQDPGFVKAIEDTYVSWELQTQPSFSEIMEELRNDRFLTPERKTAIAAADVDTYVAYLRDAGSDLTRIVSSLMTMEQGAQEDAPHPIRDRIQQALAQLSEESKTNKVRVAWKFGIDPEEAK